MPLFLQGHVVKASDVLLQELGDEAVLLNLSNGQYYGMDENSHYMFKTLISSPSVQAAYDILLSEYDIQAEKLSTDLEQFLTVLIENGLLTYVDDNPK